MMSTLVVPNDNEKRQSTATMDSHTTAAPSYANSTLDKQDLDRTPSPLGSLATDEKAKEPAVEDEIRLEKEKADVDDAASRTSEEELEANYPKGIKLGLIVLALCLAVFLVALDQTIIATAIPKITDQFKSLDDIAWYASAYMLTTCSFQLLYGKVYTFFSLKWTYMSAIGKLSPLSFCLPGGCPPN
jgi:hypothetical protein